MPCCTPRHAWLSLAHAAPVELELLAALRQAEPDLVRLGERLAAVFDGDSLAFADLTPERLAQRLPDALGKRMRARGVQLAVDAALERTVRLTHHDLLTPADPAYPDRIAAIDDAPPMLALSGDPAALLPPAIAIVGARRASRRGLDAAEGLARGLAHGGFSVVSGLAIGIDAAAHRGALATGGRTLAVMATGADQLYPTRHRRLAAAICEHGALLSEFPLGFQLEKDHFPIRNRLVSALSYGVVLIEAAARSGTLTTATHARRQNRDVMVLPGNTDDPAYRGGHDLLEDGATPVSTARQIVECALPAIRLELAAAPLEHPLAVPVVAAAPRAPFPEGSDAARTLLALDHDSISLDRLSHSLPIGTARLLAALSLLEAFGHADRDAAGRYSRCLPLPDSASTVRTSAPSRHAPDPLRTPAVGARLEPGVDDDTRFDLD